MTHVNESQFSLSRAALSTCGRATTNFLSVYLRSVAAGAAALFIGVGSADAGTLLYSFENGDSPNSLDGFAANGGGITVTPSTIGATVGTGSMENSNAANATFTGALTTLVPAALNSPSVSAISFDLTIAPGQQFTGAFADIGITIFGRTGISPNFNYGEQFQVDPAQEQNVALGPGTYNLTVALIGTDPYSLAAHQTYAQVLSDTFVPTGFEFFYGKSGDAPLNVYIDNVQTVVVPEPASIGVGAVGALLMLALRRRKA